jgi:hypothetical protein
MTRLASFLFAFATVYTAATTVHADHHLQLSEELKPLQFLVGSWFMEWEGDDGVASKITLSVQPDAQGHVLRSSGEWLRDGETGVSWFELFFDKGQSQGLTKISVVSNGARAQGSTNMQDGMLVTKAEGTNRSGDKIRYETHLKMVDENTITSQRVNIVVNGEARDDWPIGTYKRVKQ